MRHIRDHLWIGPTVAAVFAILVCLAAYLVGTRYDANVSVTVTEDTMVTVLTLFASSMLTVATFSLSAIATSAGSVSASTTPRAAAHVITDARGRVALSSFIAAFVYSIVGILALVALQFGELGRLLLFFGLIAIVVIVLVAFITWVDRVLKLGRHQHVVGHLLRNAIASLDRDSAYAFGALPWDSVVPDGAVPVHHDRVGRVVSVSTRRAQSIAEARDVQIILTVRPGDTVEPTTPMAYVVGDTGDAAAEVADQCARDIRRIVDLELQRTQDQDVRFNVLMLAETADRALSPGINDPGSAIVVLDLLLDFFVRWVDVRRDAVSAEARAPRVRMPLLRAEQLVNDAFGPIARDGASIVEVGVRLQKVLAALTRLGDDELTAAAAGMSRTAVAFTRDEMSIDEDRRRVETAALAALLPSG